ncbi:unnamed protein product [Larinioides sclopetarius]|uniref:Conotoxin n=1 Tax=Larinioides sclopetarius TaxID=280406 RepID=A0AAV2BVV1_9ARAC
MRFHFVLLAVLCAMSICWSPVDSQRPLLNRLSQAVNTVDRAICQGCPFLSRSHRDGCCNSHKIARCC